MKSKDSLSDLWKTPRSLDHYRQGRLIIFVCRTGTAQTLRSYWQSPRHRSRLNIITESYSLEPLTKYIQTESFRAVVGLINKLGSLEGIKMEQYSECSWISSLYFTQLRFSNSKKRLVITAQPWPREVFLKWRCNVCMKSGYLWLLSCLLTSLIRYYLPLWSLQWVRNGPSSIVQLFYWDIHSLILAPESLLHWGLSGLQYVWKIHIILIL